jgi:hypothetical protein
MAVATEIDDGTTSLFWLDRWVHRQRIEDLAPRLFQLVPKRVANRITVVDALTDSKWVQDLHGHLTELVLHDFLLLSELVAKVSTQPGHLDKHFWCLSASRQYSTKSAYEASFQGSVVFGAYDRIWKTWAPPKCAFFLWLAIHKRYWTTDRLAKNLPHPSLCLFCDQVEEFIDHLLVGCAFFFLEHAGELRIIILSRRKRGQVPQKYKTDTTQILD